MVDAAVTSDVYTDTVEINYSYIYLFPNIKLAEIVVDKI